jgi:hypothetical protein
LYFPPTDPDFRLAVQIDRRVHDLVSQPSVQLFAAARDSLRKQGNIYVVDGPPIVGLASGTLFRVGDHHFIVTAAHIAEQRGSWHDRERMRRVHERTSYRA